MAISLTDLQKKKRLAAEYRAVMRIPINSMMAIKIMPNGKPPEETTTYFVTYNFETRVNANGQIRPQYKTVVRFDLGQDFPAAAPTVTVVDGSPPWHPNWYTSGRMCVGNMWTTDPWLYKLMIKVGKTLAFDCNHTNPASPANSAACSYWHEHLHEFPLVDISKLPTAIGY